MKMHVQIKMSLTVECNGQWADDCTLSQLLAQAKREALDTIDRATSDNRKVRIDRSSAAATVMLIEGWPA